jgi:hypothetical protein
MYSPCRPGAKSLIEGPASDGAAPGKSMAEAWQRSTVGSWLEWILRKVEAKNVEALQKLDGVKKTYLGPLSIAKKRMELARTRKPKEGVAAARRDYEALKDQAQRDYAKAIRTAFPNPFK